MKRITILFALVAPLAVSFLVGWCAGWYAAMMQSERWWGQRIDEMTAAAHSRARVSGDTSEPAASHADGQSEADPRH